MANPVQSEVEISWAVKVSHHGRGGLFFSLPFQGRQRQRREINVDEMERKVRNRCFQWAIRFIPN